MDSKLETILNYILEPSKEATRGYLELLKLNGYGYDFLINFATRAFLEKDYYIEDIYGHYKFDRWLSSALGFVIDTLVKAGSFSYGDYTIAEIEKIFLEDPSITAKLKKANKEAQDFYEGCITDGTVARITRYLCKKDAIQKAVRDSYFTSTPEADWSLAGFMDYLFSYMFEVDKKLTALEPKKDIIIDLIISPPAPYASTYGRYCWDYRVAYSISAFDKRHDVIVLYYYTNSTWSNEFYSDANKAAKQLNHLDALSDKELIVEPIGKFIGCIAYVAYDYNKQEVLAYRVIDNLKETGLVKSALKTKLDALLTRLLSGDGHLDLPARIAKEH